MSDLPPISEKLSSWPWILHDSNKSNLKSSRVVCPRLSIITPSFNQGQFIEETIRSVLLQNYPNLEYIIIDGGSTDNTLEIIKKYESQITFWTSEPDKGQSDAINKGFQRATGIYGNWLNSDDMLEPDALWTLARQINPANEKTVFIGNYLEMNIDEVQRKISSSSIRKLEELVDIAGHWRNGKANQIGQQATFFPISLFKEVGMLNVHNHYTMDYELWGKFLAAGAIFKPVNASLGIFRVYQGQKISARHKTTKSLIKTALKLINTAPGWPCLKKFHHRKLLLLYSVKYYYGYLRSMIGIRRRMKQLFTGVFGE